MAWIEEYESGDVGHGVGGEACCVNNHRVGLGGAGGWIDHARLIFSNGDDGWLASSFDRETEQKVRLRFPSVPGGQPDAYVAANVVFGGGGHYAAWRAPDPGDPQDARRGLYTSAGLRLPDGGLLAMGPDGACAYVPSYQAGQPTRVRELDGSDWELTPGYATDVQLLGLNRAVWMQGTTAIAVASLPLPAFHPGGGVWRPQAAFAAGGWWLAYYSGEKGVVLHPFSSAQRAYSIAPSGDAWHTMRANGLYSVRIAISRTRGEGPGDVWGYDVDVRDGSCRPLPFGVQPQEPTTLPFLKMSEINPPSPVEMPSFHFLHATSTVVFKDPIGDSGAPAEILVNQNSQRRSRPLFVADDSVVEGDWIGPLLGLYTEATGEALAKAVTMAEHMRTRLLACHDSIDPWTLPPGLRAWDVVAMETYRYPQESLEEALARWRRDAREMLARWPGDCAVVPMFYCMGGTPGGNPPEVWSVAEVLDTQRHLSEIVNLSPRIKIVAPFSYLRGNGIVEHVELRQSFQNLLVAAPHAPALTPVPGDSPEPPTPTPAPRYLHKRGTSMTEIDGKIVVLRGPKGMLMRPDAEGTGIWKDASPRGLWRGALFDVADASDVRAHYAAKKLPNGRYLFTSVQHDCRAGEDAGQYTPDVLQEFYHQPSGFHEDHAGDLEQWRVYDGNENGALEAQCEQVTDDKHPSGAGKKFFAYPLAVEVV